ncbi:hypothetical protein KAR91_11535 [Candidatus Pacearchaeota archaeon]|nr:hypothetical protein [Candidatus Pacearchaeota archaeon]
MLLELTLTEDDEDFGPEGTKILMNDSYVVGVVQHGNGSKILVDLSDLEKFKTLYVKQAYTTWYMLRLNP